MIAFSPDEWHALTPSAAAKPKRPTGHIKKSNDPLRKSYVARVMELFKSTAKEWVRDRCPQLGAALAYYTVFSLAPLVIVLLGVFGLIYGSNQGAREKILEQLRYYLDPNGMRVIQDVATSAAHPTASVLATVIGALVALFGASCIFGQLQDALNTIWSVRPKPNRGFSSFVRAPLIVCDGWLRLFLAALVFRRWRRVAWVTRLLTSEHPGRSLFGVNRILRL